MSFLTDGNANPVPVMRIKSHGTIAYDGSVQSSAFSPHSVVRIVSTTACYIDVNDNPTATSSTMYLPSDTVDYVIVPSGHKIAAIKDSTAGTLHYTVLE